MAQSQNTAQPVSATPPPPPILHVLISSGASCRREKQAAGGEEGGETGGADGKDMDNAGVSIVVGVCAHLKLPVSYPIDVPSHLKQGTSIESEVVTFYRSCYTPKVSSSLYWPPEAGRGMLFGA